MAGLALAAIAAAPSPMWCQWNGTNPVWTNSHVGIGTTSPSSSLDIELSSGAAGVAAHTTDVTNYSFFQLGGGAYPAPYANFIYFGSSMSGTIMGVPLAGLTAIYPGNTNGPFLIGHGASQPLVFATNGAERVRIDSSGQVGIGTTNPQYKLAVNGTIGTKEVIVTNTGWSDYVFKPGYRLRPLAEISAYIGKHHHLPDIPSESEVKAKGVSVGEMEAKLLAKIEELTLHMIQADEKNRELQARISQLEAGLQERKGGGPPVE